MPNFGPGQNTLLGKLDLTRSFWDKLVQVPLHSSASYTQEGSCLIQTTETGLSYAVANISAGAAKEKFMGIALSDSLRLTDYVHTQSSTVPSVAPFTVTLEKTTATAGSYFIQDSTGSVYTDVSPGAPAGATQYSVSGTTVTFHSGATGKSVVIRFTYTPTIVEVESRWHASPLSLDAMDRIGQVEVAIGFCRVYTTHYDSSRTFTVGGAVYTGGASCSPACGPGKFTTATTAVQVAGVCVQVPSASDIFLGVEYNVSPGVVQF